MKNIYVIPTDKPSRLCYVIDTEKIALTLFEDEMEKSKRFFPEHIYITSSDEDIKEDDWCLDIISNYLYKAGITPKTKWTNQKKIILTTDQDLVSDGVQEINDEFLECFVQNPDCEFVGIEKIDSKIPKEQFEGYFTNKTLFSYKIIIPKEELEQRCTCGVCDYCEEQESIQILKEAKESSLKQETFQERVDYISFLHKQNLNGRETEDQLFEAGIIAGIEETEELMLDLMDAYADDVMGGCTLKAKEWFEKHKKK
jgi:hypothetical protein